MPHLDPQRQREFALQAVEQLRAAGFEAYWAGGCVRDHLLDRQPKDYDVATNATPDEICGVFQRRKTLKIGAAFGVIAVVGPRSAGTVEVTTFRRDATYSDGRRPDAVTFSTAQEDAQRRDFTINGLFFDPVEERVIDFVGGQEDLGRRIVRAIGEPRERFAEDKLRMLRAVRMAVTFDFALDAATFEGMREMAEQVTVVSVERIAQELRMTLVLPARVRAAELLRDSGLMTAILPEVAAMCDQPRGVAGPNESWWDYALRVLGALGELSFTLALAALLQVTGAAGTDQAAKIAEGVARRWRLSNDEVERVEWLVQNQHALRAAASQPWSRIQRLLIAPGSLELLALHEAQAAADGLPTDDLAFCRQRLAWPAEELNPPPLVTGNDLIAHGITPGPDFAILLESVRDAQLEGTVRTRSEALAWVEQTMASGRPKAARRKAP
jgi:poly(A) polymerase